MDLKNISRVWNYVESIFTPMSIYPQTQWREVQVTPALIEALDFLKYANMYLLLEEWLLETIFQDITKRVNPFFWKFFEEAEDGVDLNTLSTAFEFLCDVYKNHYSVSMYRFEWLVNVSMRWFDSGPTMISSAFTPVKAGFNFSKVVRLRNMDRQKSLTGKVEMGQLGVHFEKGTKGDEMELEKSAGGLEESGLKPRFEDLRFESKNVSDISFNASTVSQDLTNPSLNTSLNRVSNILEEEEDEESFIRSPLGGGKKFSSSSGRKPGFIKTPTQALHHPSITSTPGEALNQTPGSITPISFLCTPDAPLVTETPGPEKPAEVTLARFTKDGEYLPTFDQLRFNPSRLFRQRHPDSPDSLSEYPDVEREERPPTMLTLRLAPKVQGMIRSVMFGTLSQKFKNVIKKVYSQAFEMRKMKGSKTDGSVSSGSVKQKKIKFKALNLKLEIIGLMELIAASTVTDIVQNQIEKYIEDSYKGDFETTHLKQLEKWIDKTATSWLRDIFDSHPMQCHIAPIYKRVKYFLYQAYAKSLIVQFFDIIIDYPESKSAIHDLKACLEKTDLRSELIRTLKQAIEGRLLHPGVNTADILTAYISAIKCLRILEPAGVILELVCEPIGRYLRSREDTVRCIVASLTDEGNNELISELVNTKHTGEDSLQEDGNMIGWESWMPDPVDADPSTLSKNRRSADILSTLVNIYGSKELFVNEYRALLADRILMQYNYDVERELRYLELLKLRFGEAQLHFCEVMLRDVTESRRVNARIQETKKSAEKNNEVEMNAMILSAQFWPAFRDEKITLPSDLQELLDKYTKAFEVQKQNRTLIWKPHLGLMNIDIELKEETLNFSVSPVHAAIIMKFQNKTKWTVEELSSELEMTTSVLRRKIAFWQGQGILREVAPDVYQLVEEKRGRANDLIMVDEEEIESAMASAQQQKEEEMQVFWTYIQGMLANLDSLTLERIHSMLRMFAMEEPSSSEVTQQELKIFLDNKVKDQVLTFSGGVYRLNK